MGGLGIFVTVVLLGEGVLWPAERRLQVALAASGPGVLPDGDPVRRDARVMALSATTALVLLVAGSVLMVAQP
jgi:hypothetical protein